MTSLALKSAYGLKILSNKHKAIRKIRDQANIPEIHGDKIWYSSYFIMDYLLKNPIAQKSKVIEIGCGWGILSIFCAKEFDSKVIGVDADSNVIPFLQVHAKKNEVKIKTKVCRYENLKPKLLAGQDLIVGGDICFWDELVEPLFKLIKLAMRQQVGKIIIADPGRTPFLKLAKRCQKKYKAELIPASTRKKDGYLLVING
jgi:predicted nicotinamide N-methyase